ncbi:MAG TPA: glucoamylase family protein, partial [Chitinophagaceae bacterium]|nr:glucoamylase family protein [Chitinophagaceae bacterium]
YISLAQLIERTANSMHSIKKLERYCGHLYNWYDTLSLQPLHPRYISSVDSGNFAGHLLTLKSGLITLCSEKFSVKKMLAGLDDTCLVIRESCKNDEKKLWEAFQSQLEDAGDLSSDHTEINKYLQKIAAQFEKIKNNLSNETNQDLYWWLTLMDEQIKAALEQAMLFIPWLSLPAVPEKCKEWKLFAQTHSLYDLTEMYEIVTASIKESAETPEESKWMDDCKRFIYASAAKARQQIDALISLSDDCENFANIEYDFLYDKSQHLLAIGYNVEEHRRDASFYDLLASEARLSSFVAIAQGKIPQENWFALGRRLTNAAGNPVLLSWSGSMFEYLMPNLVMPSYDNTLLDETNKGVVKKQIDYGRQHNTPWGISESCYNVVDAHLNYQYRAFGVPGLGFKRGLADDFVIAPYASFLGLMIDPDASCSNLQRMSENGYEGKYGFFESIDFTPSRLPRGQNQILIQTFMAHHLGMSLLSLAYILLDQPMQKRFEAEPRFQATLLLLQEQIPKASAFYSASADIAEIITSSGVSEMRVIKTPHTSVPEVQLLSNGNYHVMITNAGGGYSRWKENAVTRWREDTTCDNWGTFCFIRDLKTGVFWSSAHQPSIKEAKIYEAVFSQSRAEFRRLDNDIEMHTEIVVSPEDDIEIRRMQISNRSDTKKEIEITSYAEVVIANPVADAAHPAFSNLFVETEIIETQHAILCTRRPRSKDEQQPWMFHLMKVNNKKENSVSYETDRNKFIGRGNTIRHPQVMNDFSPLSNTQGSVLDPVVSVRYTITLDADETIMLDMMLGIAETKDACKGLIDKYQDRHLRDRAFELAWTHSQVVLRQINATEPEGQLYGKLAGSVIYTNPYLRAQQNILLKNHRGQSALWSYSISGDLPIVLLQITASENMSLVKQLIQARAYWQLKGLIVDLFIWNEDQSGYRQVLQDQIQSLVVAASNFNTAGRQGGIFVRPADQISAEDRILLQTVARVIISDKQGSLADQLNKKASFK